MKINCLRAPRGFHFLLLAAFLPVGCTHGDRFHLTKSGRQLVPLEDRSGCCVIDSEELGTIQDQQHVSYYGTKNHYHIITWWAKILPTPDVCGCYALPEALFTPDHPHAYGEWGKHPESPLPDELRHRSVWIAVGRIRKLSIVTNPVFSTMPDRGSFAKFDLEVDRWEKGEMPTKKRLYLYMEQDQWVAGDASGEVRVYSEHSLSWRRRSHVRAIERL